MEESNRLADPVIVFKSDMTDSRKLAFSCLSAYARYDALREKELEEFSEGIANGGTDQPARIAAKFDVSGGDEIQGSYYFLDEGKTIDKHYPAIGTAWHKAQCERIMRKECRITGLVEKKCKHKDRLNLSFHNAIAVSYALFQHEQTNRCYNYAYIKAGEGIKLQKNILKSNVFTESIPPYIFIYGDNGVLNSILDYCMNLGANSALPEHLREKVQLATTGVLNAVLDFKSSHKQEKGKIYHPLNKPLRDALNKLLRTYEKEQIECVTVQKETNAEDRASDVETKVEDRAIDVDAHMIHVEVIKNLLTNERIFDAEQPESIPVI